MMARLALLLAMLSLAGISSSKAELESGYAQLKAVASAATAMAYCSAVK